MATYKVLQDIEAEDKLLGPLTLKQFVFAAITIVLGFIEFRLLFATDLGPMRWLFFLVFLLPTLIFGFLAAPLGRDQPNEIWLIARLRYAVKPHRRIWDQSGIAQLVTITAPKRIEQQFTNNLSQNEVRSRLQALANTLDSRGWAIKNVDVNLYTQPGYLNTAQDSGDRLIDPEALPHDVPSVNVQAADDIMDERSNPIAQHLDQMVKAASQARKSHLMQNMGNKDQAGQGTPPANYWFMNNSAPPATVDPGLSTFQTTVINPGSDTGGPTAAQPTADEEEVIKHSEELQAKAAGWNSHLRHIEPLGAQPSQTPQNNPATPDPQATVPPNPAILNLANNDDLNVATIARQAKRITEANNGDEVVISLH